MKTPTNEHQSAALKGVSDQAKLSRHCVATITTDNKVKLCDAEGFAAAMTAILERESVWRIGEVTHSFSNQSFTSVVALAESHISVHTWVEYRKVQLDVFLCNYMHDNTEKCERIFESIIEYFDPSTEAERTYIDRL